MKACTICSEKHHSWARACRNCGEPFELFPEPDDAAQFPPRALGIAAEFAIAAGLLLAAVPFLPFAEAGSYANAGLAKLGTEATVMFCAGGITACFGVISLFVRRRFVEWYLLSAAVAAGMTLYYHLAVEQELATSSVLSRDLGLGLCFGYLGAAFAFVAGAICLVRRPSAVARARFAGVAESLGETAVRMRPRLRQKPGRG